MLLTNAVPLSCTKSNSSAHPSIHTSNHPSNCTSIQPQSGSGKWEASAWKAFDLRYQRSTKATGPIPWPRDAALSGKISRSWARKSISTTKWSRTKAPRAKTPLKIPEEVGAPRQSIKKQLSIHPSIHSSTHPSIYPSIHPSIYPPIHPSLTLLNAFIPLLVPGLQLCGILEFNFWPFLYEFHEFTAAVQPVLSPLDHSLVTVHLPEAVAGRLQ